MADADLPAPLVSLEVDLRGFSGFMLDVDRLLASELVALGTPEECWAALMLWCRAWKQSPPASLPSDDRVLAAFSGAGKRWPKVKGIALRGFVKCSDGRLYHPVLAFEAMKAWKKRQQYGADQKRLQKWREDRKAGVPKAFQNGDETRFETPGETVREPDRQGQGQGQGQGHPFGDSWAGRQDPPDRGRDTLTCTREGAPAPAAAWDPDNPFGSDDDLEPPAPASRPAAPPPSSLGTRIAADWQPSGVDGDYASRQGLTPPDIDREAENFRDFWLAKPGAEGRRADWPAAWRTWTRNAVKFRQGRSGGQGGPSVGRPMSGAASAVYGAMVAADALEDDP